MHGLFTLKKLQNDPDPKLTAFLEEGYGCKRNGGNSCSTSFSREHYEISRMQCAELSKAELDLVILGQIAALLKDTTQTGAHRPSAERQRTTMVFHHHGVPICRETFLKLHSIGKIWCTKLHNGYKSDLVNYRARPFQEREGKLSRFGLTTRVHGNCRRKPKHALAIEELKSLVTFLNNYAEKNAILLPGRIPGYKRDTIQLLPSSTTKKVHIHSLVTQAYTHMHTQPRYVHTRTSTHTISTHSDKYVHTCTQTCLLHLGNTMSCIHTYTVTHVCMTHAHTHLHCNACMYTSYTHVLQYRLYTHALV